MRKYLENYTSGLSLLILSSIMNTFHLYSIHLYTVFFRGLFNCIDVSGIHSVSANGISFGSMALEGVLKKIFNSDNCINLQTTDFFFSSFRNTIFSWSFPGQDYISIIIKWEGMQFQLTYNYARISKDI